MFVDQDRILKTAVLCVTTDGWPAVIGTCSAFVHFFPDIQAYIVDIDPTCFMLDRKRERIAEAKCPNVAVLAPSAAVEGVVGGNRTYSRPR